MGDAGFKRIYEKHIEKIFFSLSISLFITACILLPGCAGKESSANLILDTGEYLAANGELFTYEKALVDDQEMTYFKRKGQTLNTEEITRYELENPKPVVDPQLRLRAFKEPPGTKLELMVWLRNRPGASVSLKEKKKYKPRIEALSQDVRAMQRKLRPEKSLDSQEEVDYKNSLQVRNKILTKEQRAVIDQKAQKVEALEKQMRKQIDEQIVAAVQKEHNQIEAKINDWGGKVKAHMYSQNAIAVVLPAGNLPKLAKHPLVSRIITVPVGKPDLSVHAISLGVDDGFWANGIDGGKWDAGLLDTGVQQDHPNLRHLSFFSKVGSTDYSIEFPIRGHGTGMAGIIASDHINNRGLAFGIDKMFVGDGYDVLNAMNHAEWMVTTYGWWGEPNWWFWDDAEVINLSFSYGLADAVDYSDFDQFWDGLIDDTRTLVCKSAGNEGPGAQTLTQPASAYNVITVGNVFDQNSHNRNDDVIAQDSSRGPTKNGRKKPDISAPGEMTFTTRKTWEGVNPDFDNFNDTSAATAHVSAAVLLLTDLRGSDDPLASKAVLINTADAWTDNGTLNNSADDQRVLGSEWNPSYGWGYLDLWEAWFNGLDVFVDEVDDGFEPSGTDYKLYHGYLYRNEKSTLVWNRHVGYRGSNFPHAVERLTDLDLYVYDKFTGEELVRSFSGSNNVEQVAASKSGDVVLKVDVWGTIDDDVGIENFALATEEHFQRATPPGFYFSGVPAYGSPGMVYDLTVTVRNTGDVDSFNNSVNLAGPSIVSGPITQDLGTIPAGSSKQASWQVRYWVSGCRLGDRRSVTLTNNGSGWGETFSSSSTKYVGCRPHEP